MTGWVTDQHGVAPGTDLDFCANIRCMANKAPTRVARFLLEGLLADKGMLMIERPVVYKLGKGRTETIMEYRPDWQIKDILKRAGLIRQTRRAFKRKVPTQVTADARVTRRESRIVYRTTVVGLAILQHWANTRKGFAPFLKAHLGNRDRWLKRYKNKWVTEAVDKIIAHNAEPEAVF